MVGIILSVVLLIGNFCFVWYKWYGEIDWRYFEYDDWFQNTPD